MKQFFYFEESQLGKQERDFLISIWKDKDQLKFIQELEKFTLAGAEFNAKTNLQIDLAYWHQVLNIIDLIMANLILEYKALRKAEEERNEQNQYFENKVLFNQNGGIQQEKDQQLHIILKFLKSLVQQASNGIYFNLSEHLVEIYLLLVDNYTIREDILTIFINIAAKLNDKKCAHNSEKIKNINSQIKRIIPSVKRFIKIFKLTCDLFISKDNHSQADKLDIFRNQMKNIYHQKEFKLVNEQEKNDFLYEKNQILLNISSDLNQIENLFVLCLKAINLYLNVGDLQKYEQALPTTQLNKLEKILIPKITIERFINLLNISTLKKKTHSQLINSLFLFAILDLNQVFGYSGPHQNLYYLEICKYPDFYIQTLQTLVKYHSYDKLKIYKHSLKEQNQDIQEIQNVQETLNITKSLVSNFGHGTIIDEENFQIDECSFLKSEALKSQKFLNNFLNFLYQLLNIKNKPFQNQLYSQFLKPILALISVKAIKSVYPININCQLKASKLLKDVVRQASIDDPCAVSLVIQRVKNEIEQIFKDGDQVNKNKFYDDDTENNIYLMSKQDFVRTCLRFLCYSIIRNDPSVQLVTYVFNDLPQKIPFFLENGLLTSVINSLSLRIPVQQEVFTFVTKLLYMISLNSEGAKLVASSNVLYTLVSLACENKSYHYISAQMKEFNFKEQIQSLALINQDIANKMYSAIINNFKIMAEKAWEVSDHFIQMELKIKEQANILTEIEKNDIKSKYEIELISLEYCFENTANLLWFYVIDEPAFGDDNIIHRSIKNHQEHFTVLQDIIAIPIVASGCPGMFRPFIEVTTDIAGVFGEDFRMEFLNDIIKYVHIQINNVHICLGSNDLDSLQDIEKQVRQSQEIVLAERCQDPIKLSYTGHLKGEDQISVIFGKIQFYCEILRFNMNPVITKKIIALEEFQNALSHLFKIQALVNRYHSEIYEKELQKSKERCDILIIKYGDLLNKTNFFDYKYQNKTNYESEQEECLELYYKHYIDTIKTLQDKNARISHKTVIELQLEENMSHTSNVCQLSIRKLIFHMLKQTNRKKIHFSDDIDINIIKINQILGKLIAQQFRDFSILRISEKEIDEIYIMKICCQQSAVLGEFNKILFQNQLAHGGLLMEFIDNNGIKYVEDIVIWIIKKSWIIENSTNKSIRIDLCKHIQLLWSHIIDFYIQLIEGKYFDAQYQQFLMMFKQNPQIKIEKENIQREYELCQNKMKKYYQHHFIDCIQFLFQDLNKLSYVLDLSDNIFQYFDRFSELFFSSYIDIYYNLCTGLISNKIFVQNSMESKNQAANKQQLLYQDTENYKKLTEEYNYSPSVVSKALEQSHNNFEIALKSLEDILPFQSPEKRDIIMMYQDQQENMDNKNLNTFDQLIDILEYTLPLIYEFQPNNPKLISKIKILENIFFTLGLQQNNQRIQNFLLKLKDLILHTIDKKYKIKDNLFVGILAFSFENLLRYKRAELLENIDIFKYIFQINSILKFLIEEFNVKISTNIETKDNTQNKNEIFELTQQIIQCLQLFVFIAEENKITSDINKTQNILNLAENQNQLSQIVNELKQVDLQNKQNIFGKDKVQSAQLLQEITLTLILLFKSQHQIAQDFENFKDLQIQTLIFHGLLFLNFIVNIKDQTDFDFRQFFVKNDGISALFGIKIIYDKGNNDRGPQLNVNSDKNIDEIYIQSKILLQQLCSNEQAQIKIYENLIKSILFIQFQERYKKEEGKDINSLLIDENNKLNKVAQQKQFSSKKKRNQSPYTKSKSEERGQDDKESKQQTILKENEKNQSKTHQKLIIKQILQKTEYGETQLSDFIQFFNEIMHIQDLQSFLTACKNICIIFKKKIPKQNNQNSSKNKKDSFSLKKIKKSKNKNDSKKVIDDQEKQKDKSEEIKNEDNKNENNQNSEKKQEKQIDDEEEVFFINLNVLQMKEMISQLSQSQNFEFLTQAYSLANQKHQVQKFQQDIIYQILDLILDQVKDQQMCILKICKQKQQQTQQSSVVMPRGHQMYTISIDRPNNFNSKKYIFDFISLLSHLTFLITNTPSLVYALLKHKDGKTFKFLIRNIYFLSYLSYQQYEVQTGQGNEDIEAKPFLSLSLDLNQINQKQIDTIVEFFKRVMFDNPHLNFQEKKMKSEARQVFIKETLKNLNDTQAQKFPMWPILKLVFNIGSIWLQSIILMDEEKSEFTHDKKVEPLVEKMQKFRNIQRNNMIKSLILECQSMQKVDIQQNHNFNFVKQIERIQKEIQNSSEFFYNVKDIVDYCMNLILCILRPFENNKTLWGDKAIENDGQINEKNLGFFVQGEDQSVIEESDEEDDDGEDSDESSSDDQDEDDDLLQSERSGRQFEYNSGDEREHNNHEDGQDYGSEEDGDDDDDDEDENGIESSSSMDIQNNLHDDSEAHNNFESEEDDYGNEEEEEELIFFDNLQQILGNNADLDIQIEDQEEEKLNKNNNGESNKGDEDDEEDKDNSQGQSQENNEEEDEDEDEEYVDDDEDDEDENIDDDLSSSSQLGERSFNSLSESSYGSEDLNHHHHDHDEEEIEIIIGRQNNDMESVEDRRQSRQQRRIDVISLNNLSLDMFNMNMNNIDGGNNNNDRNDDDDQESQVIEVSQSNRNNANMQEYNGRLNYQFGSNVSLQIGDFIENILQLINTNQRLGQSGENIGNEINRLNNNRLLQLEKSQNQNKGKIIYDPTDFIGKIFDIIKQMQKSEEIYKLYINQSNDQTNQQSIQQQILNNHDEDQNVITTMSNDQQTKNKEQVEEENKGEQQQDVQINTNSNQYKKQYDFDADMVGLDPEFLQNLDDQGLQNIFDTENVINNIIQGHQQTQSVSTQNVSDIQQLIERTNNPQLRQGILSSLSDQQLEQLPAPLFAEALALRMQNNNNDNNQPNNFQLVQIYPDRQQRRPVQRRRDVNNLRRSRFMSIDSQFNDLTDFSRNINDPFFNRNKQQVSAFTQINLKQNTLYNNFLHYLNDESTFMNNQIQYDSKGNDVQKSCEQVILQSFTLQGDQNEKTYQKVQEIVDICFMWMQLKQQGKQIKKIERILKILIRIPGFRYGLLIKILNTFKKTTNDFYNHIKDQESKINKKLKSIFCVQDYLQKNANMHITDFIQNQMRNIKEIEFYQNKVSNIGSIDILKIPSQDVNLIQIFKIFNQEHYLNLDQSVLETILEEIKKFNDAFDLNIEVIYRIYKEEQKVQFFDVVYNTLSDIIKHMTNNEIYQSEQIFEQIQPRSQRIIETLGNLLIFKRQFDSKNIIKYAKQIFINLSKNKSIQFQIIQQFNAELNSYLDAFILKITDSKTNLDEIKQIGKNITQLLQIAKGISTQQQNICDEQQYFQLMNVVNQLIDQKLNQQNLIPIVQNSIQSNATALSFIFKDDFRSIMIVLFILIEYNLSFIFKNNLKVVTQSSKQKNDKQSKKKDKKQQNQRMEIEMQNTEEIKEEILNQTIRQDKTNLMDAIESHLKLKISDEKIREDQKLKVFIKFCLEHKKIINSFIRANQQILNESIRNVVMQVPQILDFDNKRLLFRSELKKQKKKYRLSYISLNVRRDQVFADSFEQMRHFSLDKWKGKIQIEFADEQGVDEGGLTKEWFIQLSQGIFNPDLVLFTQSNAGSSYYPNQNATIQEQYIQYFKFIGRIVGKALYEQQLLDCYFVKAFYKIMLGMSLNYHDVEDFDNELYKNLKWCLENQTEGIGLTFIETLEYFGTNTEVELIPGGKDIEVNDQNKFEYVQKKVYYKLYLSVKNQIDSFLEGFYEIIPKELIQIFDNRELELLISGLPNIDIEDLKENTEYQNYTSQTPIIKWIWEVLEEFENSERAEFLQFVTGSSKVPVEGFKGLKGSRGIQKFQIVKVFTSDEKRLPQAHTCFKQLELPQYSSKEILKERLLTAIKEGKTFGFA